MVELPDIIIGELLDYWSAKRGPKEMPSRADINPIEIPRLLPHLYLLNVLPGPEYASRLIGTSLVDRLGFDPIGKKVSDIIEGTQLDYMEQVFATALETRKPIYSQSSYQAPSREYLYVQRIVLPLTQVGDDIAMLLVGQKFNEPGLPNQTDTRVAMQSPDCGQHTLKIIERSHS